MRKYFQKIMKIVLTVVIALVLNSTGISQTLPAPKVESPNMASFDKFGDIPVNLFTGTPNISIPIHTLKYGNISVPIALRYHPGSVRVAQHPGWVGLGWDLESIGAITRTVRGSVDEACIPELPDGGLHNNIPYYPSCVAGNPDSKSGGSWVNNDNWNTPAENLKSYYYKPQTHNPPFLSAIDVQADEFSFNFMGYSGKFYYSGPILKWQVVSDDDISIQETDFLTGYDLVGAVNQYNQFTDPNNYTLLTYHYDSQPRMFKSFVLTVPDGTKYFFGGINAIEFSNSYGEQGEGMGGTTDQVNFTVNTWLLNKIIDVNNNEINFTYRRSFPTCNLGFSATKFAMSARSTGSGIEAECQIPFASSNPNISTTALKGNYIWPMYLSKIASPNETINFFGSPSVCLRYSNIQLDGTSRTPLPTFDLSFLNPNNDLNNIPQCLNYLQWEQLNNIVITNNNQAIYRQFQFGYSSSPLQRLTLNSFTESDNQNNAISGYTFAYNDVQALPLYSGNFSDHWGFFNNINIDGSNISDIIVNGLKDTDPSYVTKGLLNQINYPTGGYTNFIWEAHDYSQIVHPDRQSLVGATGFAGGSRIKEIKSYLDNGTLSIDKKYIYKRNYTSGANVSALLSSGILNGSPQYIFGFSNRPTTDNSAIISGSIGSLNSATNYGYNGQGSYLGYDEVAEVNTDGSYAKHFFTSYGTDINGNSHYDKLPVGYIGWAPGQTSDSYLPMSTLEEERGKPIGIFSYKSNNVLVQKTVYTYRNDAERFNNFIKLIDFNISFKCMDYDGLIFASARKVFSYRYYPINKLITAFDISGNNPVGQPEAYTYKQNNLISTTTEINSKGESILNTYKYPQDEPDAISVAMTNAHILSPVIEQTVANNGNTLSYTHTNYYSPYTGIYVPQNIRLQIGSNPIETRQQFYEYDNKGNIREMSRTNDTHEVYLWSYNSQYLVAKIIGSTYSAVSSIVSQAQIDAAISSDANMRSLLNLLRTNLPNALVTNYTWSPIIGITSETDPRGRTTYYQYDSFQRLQLIKDHDGNILKTFNYQYKY